MAYGVCVIYSLFPTRDAELIFICVASYHETQNVHQHSLWHRKLRNKMENLYELQYNVYKVI